MPKRLQAGRLVREAAQILQPLQRLPQWEGASKTYSLAYKMLEIMNQDAYAAFARRRNPRKRDRYSPPEDAVNLIKALEEGDEELIKGLILAPRLDKVRARALTSGK